ncbi:tripeptidyl aminopeptidase [Streptomyces sulfonofaciens]|uniref:Tripeptidyl aminopeptidase n=1 Tax=Streptomyces sulfonofaciens TaxID=68272 RepID=A0A919GEJ1_9ACTN|nr:aminopeptidase [Streptomyces sulfonofaciens]GHH83183.1 tripeptidyl aminopeptidase [Streptomyces sulfonofaciens]
MRKAVRWLLALVVLIGTLSTLGSTAGQAEAAGPAVAQDTTADIKDRLLAVPGMSLLEEKPYDGYRFFVLAYTQPIDHRHPERGTFQQRISILHKDVDRPTVFWASGYALPEDIERAEPTRIVDGNQVTLEYRYFLPSRPSPADWSKLDIWQAASDQHRIFEALKPIYGRNWLASGLSKGGMTATYYKRFYPHDMDGIVAYVPPDDVVNDEDSAYDAFFERVGTKECRDKLNAVQRKALVRRAPMERILARYIADNDYTTTLVGSLDRTFEVGVQDLVWNFWQFHVEPECAEVPDAATAGDQEIFDYIDKISGWYYHVDAGIYEIMPYYYQAGTQLGSPHLELPHLEGLTHYPYRTPRLYVPRSIPMSFDSGAMHDVDTWVRDHASRMLFLYGQNDPWSAERFELGSGARDSYVFTVPGASHMVADVAGLAPDQNAFATARVLAWAGVAPAAVTADPSTARPLAAYDARLDRQATRNEVF